MLNFLPKPLIGVIACLLLVINVLFWCSLLLVLVPLRLVMPVSNIRRMLSRISNSIAENWISCNDAWMRLTQNTRWDVLGIKELRRRGWYLISCNHQSWADIFVLQHLLNRRAPFLKFFIKKELLYVPIIGLAWWALDYPFMKRYSKEYLKKHPEKRGRDLQATRTACKKFSLIPTSVMNFPEGTRFSFAKHERQQSPYGNLLKPKAGGLALALGTMGDKFQSLLDVTIVYPDGAPSFWDFLCGRLRRVAVHMREIAIPAQFIGKDYEGDSDYRASFQEWLHEVWLTKAVLIDRLAGETRAA